MRNLYIGDFVEYHTTTTKGTYYCQVVDIQGNRVKVKLLSHSRQNTITQDEKWITSASIRRVYPKK